MQIISVIALLSMCLFSCQNESANQQAKQIDLSLLTQPDGKKVSVYLSMDSVDVMLVRQQDIVFN